MKRCKVDPRTIDWSKSNLTLAPLLGVSLGYLSMYRRQYAPQTVKRAFDQEFDLKSIDWSRSDEELAKIYNRKPSTIARYRIKACGKQTRIDWSKIDWSLSTAALMRITGAVRQSIYLRRQQYAPETVKRRIKLPKNVDWSLTDEEIAAKYDLLLETVKQARARRTPHKKSYGPRKKHRWDDVDWLKTNQQIADEMQTTCSSVTYQRRKRCPHIKPKSIWEGIDWAMTNHQIAARTGRTTHHVQAMRKKLAPEKQKPMSTFPLKKQRVG